MRRKVGREIERWTEKRQDRKTDRKYQREHLSVHQWAFDCFIFQEHWLILIMWWPCVQCHHQLQWYSGQGHPIETLISCGQETPMESPRGPGMAVSYFFHGHCKWHLMLKSNWQWIVHGESDLMTGQGSWQWEYWNFHSNSLRFLLKGDKVPHPSPKGKEVQTEGI